MDGYDMLILSAYIVTVLLLITLADFNLTVAVKVNSCTYSPIVFTALTFLQDDDTILFAIHASELKKCLIIRKKR